MTKQQLWCDIYVSTYEKTKSTIQAESAATQAIEAFERRFGKPIVMKELFDPKLIEVMKKFCYDNP